MERQYFAFFESYFDAIEELPKKYQLAVYRAICLYGLKGETDKTLSGVTKSIFISLQPALEKNRKKSENALSKRQTSIFGETKSKQDASEQQANGKQNGSRLIADGERSDFSGNYKKESIKNKDSDSVTMGSSPNIAPNKKGKNLMVLHDNSTTKYDNDISW